METNRKSREEYRTWGKGYYHLSSDGWKEGRLFHTEAQYAYGMTVMGLLTLRFQIEIYDFTLMPNHFHTILSGTGEECVRAFAYFKEKVNRRLIKDGYPPLPEGYGFKLTPIENQEQMKTNILYLARNVFEKQISVPGGYLWGTACYRHSLLGKYMEGTYARDLSKRELERLTGSRIPIPGHWQFHSRLGLLPSSFVQEKLFDKLFPTPKEYETRLIKDYEAFVKLGESLEEELEFTQEELDDIVSQLLRDHFPGKKAGSLSGDEKGHLCRLLSQNYRLDNRQIAQSLRLPEYLVAQLLRSKDYGLRR